MADPLAASANQLRNIEARTGQSFAQLCALITASGLDKVGEQRSLLMQALGLTYGDANTLALMTKDAASAPPPADADPLDAIYTGAKTALQPLQPWGKKPTFSESGEAKNGPLRPNCSRRSPSPTGS